jgi:Predicted metal-dependent phosphoesterases (PHP family)
MESGRIELTADLHIHSTYSDGSMGIEDIVFYAKRIGLDTIAVTDHDTMAGVSKAVFLGNDAGLHVVPGVEITTRDTVRNHPVHILCYLPKKPEILQDFLNTTLKNRAEQKTGMIEKVMKLYPVTVEHIQRYSSRSQSIYESHIMQALADLGYTNAAIGALMEELISSKGSCYVPSKYPSVQEALVTIQKAGGIAVMAHPGQFDSLELLEYLAKSKQIQGAEYNHPRNTEQDKREINRIAKQYGLLLTGGTDFHGQYAKHPYPLGSFPCPENAVKNLYHLSAHASSL